MGAHDGHRERLRERFMNEGLDSFAEHNVIELLLFYCVPRKDTNELAHRLIDRFGDISGILNANPEELKKVDGIGESAATFFHLLPQVFRRYNEECLVSRGITTYSELMSLIRNRFEGMNTEHVVLVSLDQSFSVRGMDVISEGTLTASTVDLRKVITMSISRDASHVIMAHNHPSGNTRPSQQDIEVTHIVRDSLKTVGIMLVDHVIVARDKVYSLANSRTYKDIFITPSSKEE